ncbi:DNA polymerase III subunit beta [Mycoplasma sp. 1654_15]|uniref:DNA polymerase III subunit beta n=1 Tax=Mycoplasma sp. 1654_15 TaxID=2725994 RepID=UPI001449D3AE|nr:DNA polymerase III subunit beta [Mycoplasma sp. 1654_15]QJB70917.1 DNA polymerase III subunit beta [Mycoplasma sp. 1654_15]
MKFIIEKNKIEKFVDRNLMAVSNSSGYSALGGLLFELNREGLLIISTDQELSIKSFIDYSEFIEINSLGRILVNAHMLKNILKKLKNNISFEVVENNLFLRSGLDEFSLKLNDVNEFPEIDFRNQGDKLTIQANHLREAIKNTIFACYQSKETAREKNSYILYSCLNLRARDGYLDVIASDRIRIAFETVPIEKFIDLNIAVKNKNLKDFILEEIKEEIDIYVTNSKISYTYDNTTIQAVLFVEEYKNLKSVFPKSEELEHYFQIEKKELLEITSKATIISTSEKNNSIIFNVSKQELSVKFNEDEKGNSTIKTKNFSYQGDGFVFKVNYKYLKDAISVFEDKINFFISKNKTKLLINSQSNKNNKQIIGLIQI